MTWTKGATAANIFLVRDTVVRHKTKQQSLSFLKKMPGEATCRVMSDLFSKCFLSLSLFLSFSLSLTGAKKILVILPEEQLVSDSPCNAKKREERMMPDL